VFRKVILCVDDDPIALTSRRLLLAKEGYEVLVALSGSAALRLLASSHIDLLITDHFMPGMTGTELVAEMKSRDYKIPTMILTGAPEPPPGSEQAHMVLIKGFDLQIFLTSVAQLLREQGSPEGDTSNEEPE
jgi:CheY-like chemotaxis protein